MTHRRTKLSNEQLKRSKISAIYIGAFTFIGILVSFLIPIIGSSEESTSNLLTGYVIIFSIISIVGTLIMFYYPRLIPDEGSATITGLSIGMGIGTIIIIIKLL